MHLLIGEHLQNAVQSLKATKTRTLLTTIGVAIGVASITVILSLSAGVTQMINDQVSALDDNIAVVRPGTTNDTPDITSPVTQQSFSTSTITEQDVNDIAKLPNLDKSAPLMLINGAMKTADNEVKNASIVATTPSLKDVNKLNVADGQFIDSVTNQDTAVIGPQLSVDLFGTEQSIGKVFTIKGERFTVIGVLDRTNNPVNFNNVDFDKSVIISLDGGKNFHQGIAQIQQINLRAKNEEALPALIAETEKVLLKNHLDEKDFTIIAGEAIAEPTSQLFKTLTGIMTLIAIISLIVGGIGIMNIMLVSVAERTREIGLRKAVGASNAHVVSQFLIESLIVSLVGGLMGYAAGYIVAFSISTMLTFTPSFTWNILFITLGLSLIVGVFFGLYPAIKAAKKHPIESLRQHH